MILNRDIQPALHEEIHFKLVNQEMKQKIIKILSNNLSQDSNERTDVWHSCIICLLFCSNPLRYLYDHVILDAI